MTTASVICSFIREHDNWREFLPALNISVKEEPPLAIFNYGIEADFTNPIVREARGIIIRLDTLDVVCWPFTKFCNAQEEAAKIDLENFDWNRCQCQEKIDGSIVKLFWNPVEEHWQWATNSCIDASQAAVHSCLDSSFFSVIRKCDNYRAIRFDELDRDTTYIFELVSPQTQIVVTYPAEHLYHIGTRNNKTGQESSQDIGIEKPKEYGLHSLNDCMQAVQELNAGTDKVLHEGFVVVDRNWHRIKVKSPEYFAMHRMSANYNFSRDEIIKMIRHGETDIRKLAEDFPNYAVYFKYYDYKITELEWAISRYIACVRSLYEEYGHDRKAVAKMISKDKYADFGFRAIGNRQTAKELLIPVRDTTFCRLIPEYRPNDVILATEKKREKTSEPIYGKPCEDVHSH